MASSRRMSPNGFQQHRRVPQHRLVVEPQHGKPRLRRQPVIAMRVALAAECVHPAVQLQDQLQGGAAEVGDVGADGHLTPEFEVIQTTTTQHLPHAASAIVGSRRDRLAAFRVRSVGLSMNEA